MDYFYKIKVKAIFMYAIIPLLLLFSCSSETSMLSENDTQKILTSVRKCHLIIHLNSANKKSVEECFCSDDSKEIYALLYQVNINKKPSIKRILDKNSVVVTLGPLSINLKQANGNWCMSNAMWK